MLHPVLEKPVQKLFAKEKSKLNFISQKNREIKNSCKKLEKDHGIKVKCIKLDVRDYDQVKKVINSLESNWKKIDILINNAGLSRGLDKIYEGKKEDWDEMIDTNIKGLAYVTRHVVPLMVKRKKGHVINIGSTADMRFIPTEIFTLQQSLQLKLSVNPHG